jgi:serine/threonine-protein kinase
MSEAKPESKITVGAVLVEKYRVTREIGRGGMAAVYEAIHLALGKKVAVKVLAAELAASTTVIERFFREARAAASVKSPYIVDIYDSGRLEDGRPFIAMEMLEGETLYDLMTRVRLIDPRTTIRIISQCAKGLMKAHAVGIVHRDLKPENIFLLAGDDGEETLKILDFGLAKFYAPMNPDEKTARLTREGAVFGTPAYMSPEQVKGQGSVDHRADLWALGCMTFECLTGRPVWNTEQGVAMTFAAIAASSIPVPSHLRPDLPPAFDVWFKHALERDPAKRFQSARELADALAVSFGQSGSKSLKSGELDVSSLLAQIERNSLDLEDPFGNKGPAPPSGPVSSASSPGAVDSATSMPRSADSARALGQSAQDLPPTATPSPELASGRSPAQRRGAALRYAVSVLALLVSTVGAYLTWDKSLRPQVKTPVVQSTAAAMVESPVASANAQVTTPDLPKWQTALEEGQQLFAVGDLAAAQDKFKRAQEMGAPPWASRAFAEQTKAGVAGTGDCKMAAFARPRMGLGGSAIRPSVASSAKRTVMTWSDDHEQAGHQHVYAVVLDPVGRPTGRPRDLTPEAADVGRAKLVTVGDRMALVYADKTGPEVGVRVRWIDEEARIAGASLQVGGVRPGAYFPDLATAPDGFFATWEDERKQDGADLYLRHLGHELEPIGPEIRATDYRGRPGHRPAIRAPSVAVANSALYLVYKVEREGRPHAIERMRVPLDSPLLGTGLDLGANANPNPAAKNDRSLGDVVVVSEDRSPSDSPDIACGTEGCFVTWHGEKGGAFAALIDPVQGKVVWRKKFAERGAAPSLGVSDDGTVAVAYFEAGTVRIARLAREGVSATSSFARVSGEVPRPSVAPGHVKGEWFVAWQDNEGGHSEAYAARVLCR